MKNRRRYMEISGTALNKLAVENLYLDWEPVKAEEMFKILQNCNEHFKKGIAVVRSCNNDSINDIFHYFPITESDWFDLQFFGTRKYKDWEE